MALRSLYVGLSLFLLLHFNSAMRLTKRDAEEVPAEGNIEAENPEEKSEPDVLLNLDPEDEKNAEPEDVNPEPEDEKPEPEVEEPEPEDEKSEPEVEEPEPEDEKPEPEDENPELGDEKPDIEDQKPELEDEIPLAEDADKPKVDDATKVDEDEDPIQIPELPPPANEDDDPLFGFHLRTPFVTFKQIEDYFKSLESTMEKIFANTMESVGNNPDIYENVTERVVEIDGHKYRVHSSVIRGGDNYSTVSIEATSVIPMNSRRKRNPTYL